MLREQMTGFLTLAGQTYAALTTFRKDGQPVSVTVWFAQDGDRIYVALASGTEAVNHVHSNAQVEIAPCNERGETRGAPIEAMAVVLPEAKNAVARNCLNHKYGWQRRLRDLLPLGVKTVYLEITAM
ncbi:MAG TPA: PPOX class F420-dependent oxidoreductase [Phototrophicaceae bacterium]|nr:PPOX class F420-dependent oxidoreductase [Phototrophicaceae bacterium]